MAVLGVSSGRKGGRHDMITISPRLETGIRGENDGTYKKSHFQIEGFWSWVNGGWA